MKFLALIFISLLLFSCNRKENNKDKITFTGTLVIQPFTGVSQGMLDTIMFQLANAYPSVTLMRAIPLPGTAYGKEQLCYMADSLMSYLLKLRKSDKDIIIGITNEDIYTARGGDKDWGIMGLAYMPGYSCIISTFRLSKTNLHSQFYKLTVHELAHTLGLPHCRRSRKCYMSNANGENPWDKETGFCSRCKSYLKNRGFKF